MQQKIVLAVLVLLGFGLAPVYAQTTAALDNAKSFLPETVELEELTNKDWSLYADEENKVYYIDFESLDINLSDIIVRDKQGEVILEDDVFDLPVNTIYEIDYSNFASGEYDIELRSFTGYVRKTISIK